MGKKILIIEDNEDDLLILKRYLNQSGYNEIIIAENVAEGVKKAVEQKPDLVLCDTLLPDGSGFEACRQIREKCGRSFPKIIVTTGSIDAVDAVKARQLGADDYCAKTSDCIPLLEALKKVL